MCDENGIPIAIVISGANTHDVKLLNETLDNIEIYPSVYDVLNNINAINEQIQQYAQICMP